MTHCIVCNDLAEKPEICIIGHGKVDSEGNILSCVSEEGPICVECLQALKEVTEYLYDGE